MKLGLLRTGAEEEVEAVRMAYENKKMELRWLEEGTSLAELEWKNKTKYNDEGGLTPSAARPHSTPVTLEKIEVTPVSWNLQSLDSMKTQLKLSFTGRESNVPKTLDSMKSPQSFRVPSVQQSQRATCGNHAPHVHDPVAARWKAQMLS